MKILQLIPNISGGGAERLTVDLSNELSEHNEVVLLTLYDSREEDIFRCDLSASVVSRSLGKKAGFDPKVIKRLYRAIQEIRPDVIHDHLRSFNYLMPLLPFLDKLPAVHTIHNDAFEECGNAKLRYLRKQFFKRPEVVPVTISQKSAESFSEAYGNLDSKLIYNGRKYPKKSGKYDEVSRDINRLKNDGKTRIFVNIGRMIPQKNQLMLVEAFNTFINENDANAKLIIIGGRRNTPESQRIYRRLKQEEQNNDHIYILDERLNVTDYLHAADFFCLSSSYEGMPITLIEAFAAGCVPICTPVGGIPEMVNGNGFISKDLTATAFSTALSKADSLSKKKLSELGESFKSAFERNYNIEYCSRQYEELYLKLISI